MHEHSRLGQPAQNCQLSSLAMEKTEPIFWKLLFNHKSLANTTVGVDGDIACTPDIKSRQLSLNEAIEQSFFPPFLRFPAK